MVTGKGSKIFYTYDFGDNWEHEILVEKVLPPGQGPKHPECLAGKRACPPEDVGGPWGYLDFLDAIANPDHPQHQDMMEWSGGFFDPEAFDRSGINAILEEMWV